MMLLPPKEGEKQGVVDRHWLLTNRLLCRGVVTLLVSRLRFRELLSRIWYLYSDSDGH